MSRPESRSEDSPDHVRAHPWSVPVRRSEVPEAGRRFDLKPDATARAAIAQLAGVVAVPRLEANFEVTPHGRGGLHVVGEISATVEQNCVVTLEPMENAIEEPVDLVFVPASALPAPLAGDEVEVPADDAPEVLIGDSVDLGAIATEFLALGVDPYPRKPGVVFEAPTDADEKAHPFAALAALKRESKKDEG
jgi:uncharacterized metal-binding protein YceD (DUF177 family)